MILRNLILLLLCNLTITSAFLVSSPCMDCKNVNVNFSSSDEEFSRKRSCILLKSNNYDDNKNGDWNASLRKTMTLLSSIGVIETFYLTYSKLTSSNILFCDDNALGGGCKGVLNSLYATFHISLGEVNLDIPLSALGCIAYITVLFTSFYPLFFTKQYLPKKKLNDSIHRQTLILLTTSMATFSCFLVYLLLFQIHDICVYCLLSTALSFTLSVLAWRVTTSEESSDSDVNQTNVPFEKVVFSVFTTAIFSILFYASVPYTSTRALAADKPPPEGYSPPKITNASSPRALSLAQTLDSLKATMYGAYWCSHCYDQKQAFGKQAYEKYINYVECDKDGSQSQRQLCKDKKVPGYPTWEIGNKLYPGELTLDELEEITEEIKSS